MNKKNLIGIVAIVVGLLVFFWAQNHSPNADLGNKIMKEINGSFTLNNTSYIFAMIGSILLVILGVVRLFRK
ncbi:MAG: hypothetical protein ACEPOZ_08285 [Marinifilaceae bacterium]